MHRTQADAAPMVPVRVLVVVALQWLLGCAAVGVALAFLGGHGAAYIAIAGGVAGLVGAVAHIALLSCVAFRRQQLPMQVLVLWLTATVALVAGYLFFGPMGASLENVSVIALVGSMPILLAAAVISHVVLRATAA